MGLQLSSFASTRRAHDNEKADKLLAKVKGLGQSDRWFSKAVVAIGRMDKAMWDSILAADNEQAKRIIDASIEAGKRGCVGRAHVLSKLSNTTFLIYYSDTANDGDEAALEA